MNLFSYYSIQAGRDLKINWYSPDRRYFPFYVALIHLILLLLIYLLFLVTSLFLLLLLIVIGVVTLWVTNKCIDMRLFVFRGSMVLNILKNFSLRFFIIFLLSCMPRLLRCFASGIVEKTAF